MKKLSINKIAAQYSGRSRACAKCSYFTKICSKYDLFTLCNRSFIEGFIKGVKYNKSINKQQKVNECIYYYHK